MKNDSAFVQAAFLTQDVGDEIKYAGGSTKLGNEQTLLGVYQYLFIFASYFVSSPDNLCNLPELPGLC